MIPIVAGLLMGAAMGGGIAALQKKNILEGALMGAAGGALGGVLMPAAGAAGTVGAAGTAGTPAAAATAVNAFESALPGVADTVIGAGGQAGVGAMAPMGTVQAGTSGLASLSPAGAPALTSVGGAVPGSGMFSGGIGNFLSANKGALMGGGLGGMMASAEEPKKRSEGNIYDMTYSQERNPLFGQPGEPAFINQGYATNSITPVEDYKPTMMAANGGIIALAEGGKTDRYVQPVRTVDPAVAAYNAKLMERANQQYNINLPPAPNQVPGSVGYIAPRVAPVSSTSSGKSATEESISGLVFNPITQRFEGEFVAPGKKKNTIGMNDDGIYRDRYYAGDSGEGGTAGPDGPSGDASAEGQGIKSGGSITQRYNVGGLSSLGSYSDGGQLLKGPGDGVSDSIPARIGARQPARLADGEFVVPARIVSEIGNGSTDAGAKQLYAMMDRVQKNRKKSIGKGKVAVDAKSRKLLPA